MNSLIVLMADAVDFVVKIYIFIIIARAIISWVRPNPYNPAVRLLYRLTEPILHPIRNALMKFTGNIGLDFSPFIAIIFLYIFRAILLKILLS
jgi:YggT family protein